MSNRENNKNKIKNKIINNINKSKNNSQDEINNKINNLLQNNSIFEDNNKNIKEIEDIKNIFKSNLNNDSFIKSFFYKIKNYYIDSKSLNIFQKKNILSLLNILIEIEPKTFFQYTDIILSLYQNFFTELYSQLFPTISQNFGDLLKLELYSLNSLSNRIQKNEKDILISIYNKYKSFCINNILSNSIPCQICGTLCLTTLIENCSFIYENNYKIKEIFDILINQLNNQNNLGLLEVLNCFISLILCSETKYIPFVKLTVKKIIDLCVNTEWIIRKFALNIICSLMYYCQDEIFALKNLILSKLKYLRNEKIPEIKELCEQINNNFLEKDKNKLENKCEIDNLNYEEINEMTKKDTTYNKEKNNKKIGKNFDYSFPNYDNHLITEPINLNNLNKNNISKNSNNKDKNCIFSPKTQKKNYNKIVNKTYNKILKKISRAKSLGQKKILKLNSGQIKNKIKELKVNNKILKFLSYFNMHRNLGNNLKDFKKKIKSNNNRINNTKIAVNNLNSSRPDIFLKINNKINNNSFFFIKNYSLILKSKNKKRNNYSKYNKSFSIREKSNSKDIKRKMTTQKINMNMPKNIINDYCTVTNMNYKNSKRNIPQSSLNSKIKRKRNNNTKIGIIRDNLIKTNLSNNCISSKLSEKRNSIIDKKNRRNNNFIKEKNKSADKSIEKFIIKKKNINRNIFPKNLLINSITDNQEKSREDSFNSNNNKYFLKIKNDPKKKNFHTTKQSSLKIRTIFNTSKNSSTILNNKKIKQNKIIKVPSLYTNQITNNSNEKIKNHYISPLRNLNSIQNENSHRFKINKENNRKTSKIKINKTLNRLFFKNNSISICNKNNINRNLNLNNNQNNKIKLKNISSFKRIFENKRKDKTKMKLNNTYSQNSNSKLLNEFNKYKCNTNRIIFELKSQIGELLKTIYIYKNKVKEKKS